MWRTLPKRRKKEEEEGGKGRGGELVQCSHSGTGRTNPNQQRSTSNVRLCSVGNMEIFLRRLKRFLFYQHSSEVVLCTVVPVNICSTTFRPDIPVSSSQIMVKKSTVVSLQKVLTTGSHQRKCLLGMYYVPQRDHCWLGEGFTHFHFFCCRW